MKTIETFGDWVWVSRKAIGMTQKALADSVGCSTVMIRKIECGDRQPSEQLAVLLATRLSIDAAKRLQFLRMARGLAAPAIDIPASSKMAGYNVPITVLSFLKWHVLSFIWPQDLRYYVGFLPNTSGEKTLTAQPLPHPPTLQKAPPAQGTKALPRSFEWLDNWQTNFTDTHSPQKTEFRTYVDGSSYLSFYEKDGSTQLQVRCVPERDGVRIWMTLQTSRAYETSYVLAPGLAFNNGVLDTVRKTSSCVPFLSEMLMQMMGNANGTITWFRQAGDWQPFPVQQTRYHTEAGADVYEDSAGQADSALVVRETPPRRQSPLAYQQLVAPEATWETFSAGWYWERAVAISNRTPVDGPTVYVDFGPLKAGQSRTVQGKFYWVEGTKDDVLVLWRRDFGE